jgi:hypothetical protein
MIAILQNYNETSVEGIFPNYSQAEKYCLEYYKKYFKQYPYWYDELRWTEFNFGAVTFDWDEANKFPKEKVWKTKKNI